MMSKCKYCGGKTSFLQNAHKECHEKHNSGLVEIEGILRKSLIENIEPSVSKSEIDTIIKNSFIDEKRIKPLILQNFNDYIADALDDNLLTQEEEKSIYAYMNCFLLNQEDKEIEDTYKSIVKTAILREVMEGKIPNRVKISDPLPFVFNKSETLVWLFNPVDYYTHKTKKHYKGRSQGISIRVAKGLYYRTGSFKGYPVTSTENVLQDRGLLAVTNKNLFFGGPKKTIKIPYKKIIAVHPFSNGIGILRNTQNAKPQNFQTDDAWFAFNLVSNLASLAQ